MRGQCAVRLFSGLLFLVAPISIASAQNIVVNPRFDAGLTSWSPTAGTTFDNTMEASGSLTPGSAKWIGTVPAVNGMDGGPFQCVAVTGGATYDFGAKVFLTSAPAGGGDEIGLVFYSGASCTTPIVVNFSSFVGTTGSWLNSNGTATAPANAVSAIIGPHAFTAAAGGDFVENFDDFFVQPAAVVPTLPGLWLPVVAAALAGLAAAAIRKTSLAGRGASSLLSGLN